MAIWDINKRPMIDKWGGDHGVAIMANISCSCVHCYHSSVISYQVRRHAMHASCGALDTWCLFNMPVEWPGHYNSSGCYQGVLYTGIIVQATRHHDHQDPDTWHKQLKLPIPITRKRHCRISSGVTASPFTFLLGQKDKGTCLLYKVVRALSVSYVM